MSDGPAVVFTYDGTYRGMLCVVFDSFSLRTVPAEVYTFDDAEPSLLKVHTVITDEDHAARVETAISNKLGDRGRKMVERGFLYGEEGKEIAVIRFLKRGFDGGPRAISQIADPDINLLYKMVVAVNNEANMLYGFTRFEDLNGALLAVIHPKHLVLPLLGSYFKKRIAGEVFMIYDENHRAAFIHKGKDNAMVPVESLERPEGNDEFYTDLWKLYYKHIAIDSRYNPTCRMSHMPKRFWADMPEVADEVNDPKRPEISRGTIDDVKKKLAADRSGGRLTE